MRLRKPFGWIELGQCGDTGTWQVFINLGNVSESIAKNYAQRFRHKYHFLPLTELEYDDLQSSISIAIKSMSASKNPNFKKALQKLDRKLWSHSKIEIRRHK